MWWQMMGTPAITLIPLPRIDGPQTQSAIIETVSTRSCQPLFEQIWIHFQANIHHPSIFQHPSRPTFIKHRIWALFKPPFGPTSVLR